MSNLEFGIVLITAPDEQSATTIAAALVERKLAACVNIVPGVRSIYRWQGSVEDSPELLLIAKTIPARFEELKAAVVELHPYETPEAIMLDVAESLEKYARWVVECVE